jgi:hypothetical protein
VAAFPEPGRQRLESGFLRHRRLGLPLLLVGKIEILEHGQLEGGEELVLQLGRQLALPLDLLDDERLALEDLVPGLAGVDHLANRDFVQVPRLLLAVPRDERHGGALVRQLQDGGGGRDGDLGMTRCEPLRKGHARMIADRPLRSVIARTKTTWAA